MLKQVCILAALVATVALPFALRPERRVLGVADDTVVIITPHNEATRQEFGRGFKRGIGHGRVVASRWIGEWWAGRVRSRESSKGPIVRRLSGTGPPRQGGRGARRFRLAL